MIYKVTGKIIEKDTNTIVVDTGGVAYEISVSLATYSKTGSIGENCSLYTYMAVREDGISLYGFSTIEEKKLFLHLISVSSIGPKMAVKILSGIGYDKLSSAISSSDHQMLASIPGIGKKTAERIVVELKDKFAESGAVYSEGDVREEVMSALINLGYKTPEIRKALEKSKSTDDFQTILKQSLQLLSGKK